MVHFPLPPWPDHAVNAPLTDVVHVVGRGSFTRHSLLSLRLVGGQDVIDDLFRGADSYVRRSGSTCPPTGRLADRLVHHPGDGGLDTARFTAVSARFVRAMGLERGTGWATRSTRAGCTAADAPSRDYSAQPVVERQRGPPVQWAYIGTSPIAGRSTPALDYSWFNCWTTGSLHSGGNYTWHKTTGDDNGASGFAPASAVHTPSSFDANPSAHGLRHC